MVSFSIQPAADLIPDGLAALAEQAEAEGIGNVSAVITSWLDGSQRYQLPGEVLLVTVDRSSVVVGVGGLTRCPHVPGAYRVRRFYIDPRWRRLGVARALAERLIDTGFEHTDTLTCNAAASAAAPPFWEALGFEPSDLAGVTHTRTRATSANAVEH